MVRAYLALIAAGCGFQSSGRPDKPIPDGGVPEMRSFGPTELAAGQRVDMTVDGPWGSLTPNAYTYGGLVGHGLAGTKLWAHGDTSWTKLATVTATGAGMWSGEHIVDNARLDYLGVVGATTMTLWLEGEVWLDGQPGEMFQVNGDDVAFVELAPPGTAAYTQFAENTAAPVPAQVSASGAGWYPIRIGFSNGGGKYDFQFTHSDGGAGGGAQVAWTRDRLRARASELSGALRTVFGRQILAGGANGQPPISDVEQSDLLAETDFNPAPQGTASGDDWSARYSGQVYVQQAGMYSLTINSDDGNRGRLGMMSGESHWQRDDGTPNAGTTISTMLSAGWNDLLVDYNQVNLERRLRARIQGPDFTSPVEIPRDRLRPVESADDRLALGGDDADHKVTDGGDSANPGTATMTVVGYPGETVDSIEITYQINSPRWDELVVDLEPPGTAGTGVTIRSRIQFDPPNMLPTNSGDHIDQFAIPSDAMDPLATLLGGPANGDWKLNAYDVVTGGGDSNLKSVRLTLHTKGGPDKIARSASWTSAPIDVTTNLVAIDGISWVERIPAGAAIAVRFRACQQANCGDDPGWSDPVTSGMAAAAPTPGRYLQLRVEMTSNGTLEPELGQLAVMYRRAAG